MSETFQIYLILTLHRRVLQWDELTQAEFAAFQDQLRTHGLDAIFGNTRMCAVESVHFDDDDTGRIDFWLKVRGDWVFLSLEMRSPEIYVVHDTKRE